MTLGVVFPVKRRFRRERILEMKRAEEDAMLGGAIQGALLNEANGPVEPEDAAA